MISSSIQSATRIPWGSWYGDDRLEIPFPETFEVSEYWMKDAPSLENDQILEAIENSIGCPPLRELAESAPRAVIAVDDISRPTPAADILPHLLDSLSSIPDESIRILIALGAHRPMLRDELLKKLGKEALDRFDVDQHHPYENLVDLGVSNRGTPMKINRNFHEGGLKISIGCVLPHPYAGFSGGAKVVLPGLAGIETLKSNHQPAVTGISGGIGDPEVDARRDIEEIANKAGLRYSCNVVVNSERKAAGIFCGDPVEAHRKGVAFARKVFETPVPDSPVDVLVLNAYPKDTELLQAGNVFNSYRTRPFPLLKEKGTLVVSSCCSTGRGYHSLHGRNMQLYRRPGEKEYLKGREVVVFSPNINRSDFEASFWRKYHFCRTWEDLMERLVSRHGRGAKVGVLPMAPIQMLSEPLSSDTATT